MMDPLISAILDAVFATLADSVELSDWLRQRLKGDPENLAFRAALTQALTAAAAQFPGRDVRYFAEVLPQIGGPLLARYLQPAAPLPTGDELTHLWLNHLTIDSAIHYRQDFAAFAAFLLDQLNQQIENQQSLQWIVQARRQRSSDEVTRRLAETAVQSAATLDALRQEVTQLTAALETALKTGGARISTGGGSYISGSVETGGDFIGRDKVTIKNYFVAGLARLVIDYGPRIQDFLLEYLGSKRKRVPFGGRQAQLDELHAWLDDSVAPPYYLMTAEAGRGKSALVCRWLAQLTARPDLDVIFVPISIRFETATQDVVFAALAARLANLYESEPEKLPPASLTAEQWKGVCQSYLRRSPPEGKQLLVILDGLDEATGWTPGRGLFSADPPPGLRVLVTARTRPGETGASGWAATLGWDNAQLARTATLPGLQRRGVEEALASMGNPLDHLATKVDVVGELHRLSEGDPLLVRLYVDALLAQGPTVTTLRAEDLRHIQPGLAGYFERWWQDQQEQWRIQGRDPIVEQAQLRLLLNAIAAALGPLLLDDLAALHPDLSDSLLVRRLVQQVSRWLVGDGKTQGYSYSHPRLGYYFWEQLGGYEQRAWDARFCAWGERVLAELNAPQSAPKNIVVYLIRHYAIHLERNHAPAEKFYMLISNGWRRAWEALDISNSGFLEDVERVWIQAIQAYDVSKVGKAIVLTQQLKASLCWASVNALSYKMLPELLVEIVKVEICTPVQALVIAKLSPNEQKRAALLAVLIPHLSDNLLAEVLSITHTIRHKASRVEVLSRLVPHLSEEQRHPVLVEALSITHTIRNEASRVEVLSRLAPYLPDNLLVEALSTIRTIQDEIFQAEVLGRLASHLPDEQRHPVLVEALSITHTIRNEASRVEVLSRLAPHLSNEQRHPVLVEALSITRRIWNEASRVEVLSRLAPYLPDNLLAEALSAIRSIQDKASRVEVLSRLAPHLSEEQRHPVLVEALSITHTIRHKASRVEVLSRLVPHLSEEQRHPVLVEALSITHTIQDKASRVEVLSRLAPYLPDNLLVEALSTIRTIQDEIFQAEVLRRLAPHLPTGLLAEALSITRMIRDETFQARVLSRLILPPSDKQPHPMLAGASRTKHMIRGKAFQTRVLRSLSPSLTPPLSNELLVGMLNATRMIRDEVSRVQSLSGLAYYLPDEQRHPVLAEALSTASMIQDETCRVRSLSRLTEHLESWYQTSPAQAILAWVETLPVLAARPRPKFLHDLTALMPFILTLAGDEAPEAAAGIYQAIQEVCAWWP